MDYPRYLAKSGYVVKKNSLTEQELAKIREELTVKPFVPPDFAKKDDEPFKVFQENDKKIYLPRFKGIEMLGELEPGASKMPPGDKTGDALAFVGELRDFQVEPVKKMVEACREKGGGILSLPGGKGKCMDPDTQLLRYDGTVVKMRDVVVGDFLMGDDDRPRRVLSTCVGKAQMYRVADEHGIVPDYIVNGAHILCVRRPFCNQVMEITVDDYLTLSERKTYGGYCVAVNYRHRDVAIDPYALGHYIGSGFLGPFAESKMDKLAIYNCAGRDRIPFEYLVNSLNTRLKLLAGIVDTMALGHDGMIRIPATGRLKRDLIRLCRSVGFKCYEEGDSIYFVDVFLELGQYLLVFSPENSLDVIGFNDNPNFLDSGWYPLVITPVGDSEGDYCGFELDGNGRYILADSYVVTHNTVMGLKIITELGRKTLVLVHKEFLVNQWLERIGTYLPAARVGRIQADVIDIDDKDIVLGMVQSISMKDYPLKQFDSFGLVIIDECHRMPCKVFSQALMKINSKYMVGLTATPQRMDGLFKVLHWFVGDIEYIIHEDTKQNTRGVEVRRVVYEGGGGTSSNGRYDREINNKMGKINGGAMMTNLCDYLPRTRAVCAETYKLALGGRNTLILSERVGHLEEMERVFLEEMLLPVLVPRLEPDLEKAVAGLEVNSAVLRAQLKTVLDAFRGGLAGGTSGGSVGQGPAGGTSGGSVGQGPTGGTSPYMALFDAVKADMIDNYQVDTSNLLRILFDLLKPSVIRRGQMLAHDLVAQMECLDEEFDFEAETKAMISKLGVRLREFVTAIAEGELLEHLGLELDKADLISFVADSADVKSLMGKKFTAKMKTNEKLQKEIDREIQVVLSLLIRRHVYEEICASPGEKTNLMVRVGYYIGGMKPEELKESESCEIILGTYQMASEGLDIQALNTLVMATPKTPTSNVFKQATWRIMRKVHEKYNPLIVDICDPFSKYREMAAKRKTYYKKLKYEITTAFLDKDGLETSCEREEVKAAGKGTGKGGSGKYKKDVCDEGEIEREKPVRVDLRGTNPFAKSAKPAMPKVVTGEGMTVGAVAQDTETDVKPEKQVKVDLRGINPFAQIPGSELEKKPKKVKKI